MAGFAKLESVDVSVEIVEIDEETDEVHVIDDKPVSRLFVDELSYPHIIYRPDAERTKLKGRTAVFTVTKK